MIAALSLALTPGIGSGGELEVPDVVVLAELANLYPPVELDHAVHAEIAGDCASCHHQPFGEPVACADCHSEPVQPSAFIHELHWGVEGCSGCHRRDATNDLRCGGCHPIDPDPKRLDVIGLKGAYHGLCLRCHANADDPAASCVVCHSSR
jgi:hypothetical protein